MIDPKCPEHREDAKRLMGGHRGERKTFREAIKPPENFSRIRGHHGTSVCSSVPFWSSWSSVPLWD